MTQQKFDNAARNVAIAALILVLFACFAPLTLELLK